MNDRDDPAGPPPPEDPLSPPPPGDPFGPPPAGNPLGPPPSRDPFGPPPTGNPFGAPPSQNPFGTPPSSDPFGRGTPGDDPFGPAPTGQPPGPAPNEAWRQPSPAGHDPFAAAPPASAGKNAEGAIAALVLGIVGIIFCPLCAPFAWYYGRRAERLVDASGGVLDGRGEATAGKVLGIVGSVLMALAIVALIAVIGFGVSSSPSGSGDSSTFDAPSGPDFPPPVFSRPPSVRPH